MNDVKFVNGLIVKKPHPNAPDFVKCAISIKKDEMIKWLESQNGEWINIDCKESRNGNWYAQVNDWRPETGQNNQNQASPGTDDMTATFNGEIYEGEDDFDVDLKDIPQ